MTVRITILDDVYDKEIYKEGNKCKIVMPVFFFSFGSLCELFLELEKQSAVKETER